MGAKLPMQDLCSNDIYPAEWHSQEIKVKGRAAALDVQSPGQSLTGSRLHQLRDPPLAGRAVRLVLMTRCFRCDMVTCQQQIFTESLGFGVLEAGHGERLAWRSSSTS